MTSETFCFDNEDRLEVTEIAHKLYARSLVTAFDGNISLRHGDYLLITPTHLCKGDVLPEDLVITDRQGKVVLGDKRPSSEILMHLAVYEKEPAISCIVHAHPVAATAIWRNGNSPDTTILMEAEMNLAGLIMVGPEKAGSTDLAEAVAGQVTAVKGACMIERHGAVTWGQNLKETYYRMESLERLAQTAFMISCCEQCKE